MCVCVCGHLVVLVVLLSGWLCAGFSLSRRFFWFLLASIRLCSRRCCCSSRPRHSSRCSRSRFSSLPDRQTDRQTERERERVRKRERERERESQEERERQRESDGGRLRFWGRQRDREWHQSATQSSGDHYQRGAPPIPRS